MKKHLLYHLMPFATVFCLTAAASIGAEYPQSGKRVAVVIPYQGYSHGQYTTLKETFNKAGISMKIVSTKVGKATHTPNSVGLDTDIAI